MLLKISSLMIGLLLSSSLLAQSVLPRDGWVVIDSNKSFSVLLEDLRAAVSDAGFGVVTQAGPTQTARSRGIELPENRVVGVFNNDYAVRILGMSVAAMIEAPIRFYLTENPDGSATLSYKTPGFVFAPYFDEGGPELAVAAQTLDVAFLNIANAAAN